MASLSQDAKNAISVLRAVTMSRKPPTNIRVLLRDYSDMEGVQLNYKKFGFRCLEDFLNASGEFLVSKIQGEICLAVKPNKDSAHITKMIRLQKTSRKKSQRMRQPNASDQSWNKTIYSSNVFRNLVTTSPRRNRSHRTAYTESNNSRDVKRNSDKNNNYHNNNNIPDKYKENKSNTSNKAQQNTASGNSQSLNRNSQQKLPDLREHLNQKHQQMQSKSSASRAILGQSNKNVKSDGNMRSTLQKTASSNGKPESLGRTTSIQDRLKITQKQDLSRIVSQKPVIEQESRKTKDDDKKSSIPPLIFEFNPDLNPITSLAQYCTVRRYLMPEYRFLKPKFSNRMQCRVLLNGVIYSTYPDDFETNTEAQLACAQIAIEQIKMDEARNRYPISVDSDMELALKIFQELKSHPHGIFCKNIPDVFIQTFEQTLPDHWYSIIQSSSDLFSIESTAGDNLIIFAKTDTADSSAASTTSDSESLDLDRINLPWNEKYWNLYITHCVSTIEIWARIVGKEYSDQLDSLMNDIDIYMLTDKARPISIICGKLYLVCISECWHRIRVEEMDKLTCKCRCFFIDFGDEEWLPMDQLYICESRFLRLPPQALLFSLFGLEDFAENPNAKNHLDIMLSKTLIAEILTKKDAYASSDNEFIEKIQVVLYDTSSNEDVNLNPLILTKICDDTPPPELKRNTVSNVTIAHVNMNGEIFLQVGNSGLHYIQKLINQLVESKFKEDQHRISLDDIKKPNFMFLVNDIDDDKCWYRAVVAEANVSLKETNLKMFYVDYGIVKIINISKVFQLDSLSAALSKFPRQALKVKLHNLPLIDETVVARIRGLLPSDCPAIVKVVVYSTIPQVDIYRRSNEILFNVNEVIRIEYELESASELQDTLSNEIKMGSGRLGNISGAYKEPNCTSPTFNKSSVASEITACIRNLSLKSPIPPSPQKGDLPKITSSVWLPSVNEFFDVFVCRASNPSNFVVQPYNDARKLSEMMNELQDYCSNNDEFIPADMVKVGQAYAALNADGNFQRVTVENIFGSTMIQVCYCDFGDLAILSNDQLKTLPARFRALPKQAIVAKLHGIKPKHVDWTTEDCLRFEKLIVAKKFVSIIKNISNDELCPNSRTIEIQLIDVQTDEDIYIHDLLVKELRAILMET